MLHIPRKTCLRYICPLKRDKNRLMYRWAHNSEFGTRIKAVARPVIHLLAMRGHTARTTKSICVYQQSSCQGRKADTSAGKRACRCVIGRKIRRVGHAVQGTLSRPTTSVTTSRPIKQMLSIMKRKLRLECSGRKEGAPITMVVRS